MRFQRFVERIVEESEDEPLILAVMVLVVLMATGVAFVVVAMVVGFLFVAAPWSFLILPLVALLFVGWRDGFGSD